MPYGYDSWSDTGVGASLNAAPQQQPGFWDQVSAWGTKTMNDPNAMKALAQLGGAVAQNNPVVQGMAQAAVGLTEAKAAQKAAGKAGKQQEAWRRDIASALSGDRPIGEVVADPSNPINSISFDDKGGATLKLTANSDLLQPRQAGVGTSRPQPRQQPLTDYVPF